MEVMEWKNEGTVRGMHSTSRSRSRLFAEHLPGVAAYLRRRCGPLIRAKESVTDLVQSVAREALSCWSRFHSGSDKDESLRKWLFQIAKRKISARRRYWKAAKREQPARSDGAAAEPLTEPLAPDEGPSQEVLLREELTQLEQAFGKLPPEYAQVIDLAYRRELSHAEIARRLGKSEPAVRQLLSRALARLVKLTQVHPGGFEHDRSAPG